jgi:FSR family fosmidomycin resistance protein-like MFS transporter
MRLLRDQLFLTVSTTHFAVDLLGSQIAILMAFFAQTMGLSNTDIGLVTGGYSFASAFSQPFFGWLIDRIGPRWAASGGLFWSAGSISIALLLQSQASLPFLIIAGLGSGAFHPAGTMEATRRGQEHFAGRAATAASIFFIFGQAAYSIGPAIGGLLLERFSSHGLLFLVALSLPIGLNAIIRLRPISSSQGDFDSGHPPANINERELHRGWLAWVSFSLLIAFRSWAYGYVAAFLPKYLLDGGINLSVVGLLTALYMGGSALGNLAGGAMSDRWGKRLIIFGSLALASVSLAGLFLLGISSWMYAFIPLSGLFIGASQSPVVVIAQNLMPNRVATASGLVLGFMFSTEALGVFLSGLIADASGLQTVFKIGPSLAVIAALLTLTLKGRLPKFNSELRTNLKP